LAQLEDAQIVERDRVPGRREVWYRLTPAGQELRSAVEALLLWGVRHIGRPPAPDEPVRAYHLLNGTRLALDASSATFAPSVRWAWRFPGEAYTLRFDGTHWQLSDGEDPHADVVVETTPRAWAALVMSSPGARRATDDLELHGRPARVREFYSSLGITLEPLPPAPGMEHVGGIQRP
jgi:DNA-binding MarR family transcriptional regulator